MSIFNSYTVYSKDGELLAHASTGEDGALTDPVAFFEGLRLEIRSRAHTMLVLQEEDCVARYKVKQTVTTLGPREGLSGG